MNNILVVDLEATCSDDGAIAAEHMETIEIGACWVDGDGIVIDRFQSFVKPIVNRRLTPFCISLTGIEQRDVDDAPLFPAAAELLCQFVQKHRTANSIWCSWGEYDRRQIDRDSLLHDIVQPIELPHQNAKRLFAKAQRIGKEVGMAKACELTGLVLEGTHHRALDDSLNIARLLPFAFGERSLKSQISS